MDQAQKPTGKLDPAQLKALLRADIRTAKIDSQAMRALGVIEAGIVDTHLVDVDTPELLSADADRVSTSVIVSRAYQEQVAESNLDILSSGESKTSPIPRVRRAANG
jgi:hypothetical protein